MIDLIYGGGMLDMWLGDLINIIDDCNDLTWDLWHNCKQSTYCQRFLFGWYE